MRKREQKFEYIEIKAEAMKVTSIGMILFIMTIPFRANTQEVSEIIVDIDRSSMPEGIAIHPITGEIFINSIHLDKITKSDPDGTNTIDVIDSGVKHYSFGTGMMIAGNYLFACGKIDRGVRPIVLQIDLNTYDIVRTFELPAGDSAFFNDLTLDKDLNAYFTDSNTDKIYRLDYTTGIISFFMQDPGLTGPNGIVISPDQTKLYINSNRDG